MSTRSENVPGNHIAISDCSRVFRLGEPLGDRACIWEAEDGTDHALLGLGHDDHVIATKHSEDGTYWAVLRENQVVILNDNVSLLVDHGQHHVLPTPRGPFVCDQFGNFTWVLRDTYWEGSVESSSVDYYSKPTFDSESGEIVGELLLFPSGSQVYRLNAALRTITYGPVVDVREPPSPLQFLKALGNSTWRELIRRIRK